ncbi:MAG: class I SAM-dependent methyltransferase [Acidimicrobiales bacterium]
MSLAEVEANEPLGAARALRGAPSAPLPSPSGRLTPSGALARAIVHGVLGRLRDGRLHLVEGGVTRSYGAPVGPALVGHRGGEALDATVRVASPRAYSALVADRSAGLGRGYFEGWWDSEDLVSLLRILLRLARPLESRAGGVARVSAPILNRMTLPSHREDKERDRAFISAHYDLGNEFFASFLDETMVYSCGLFERPDTTLAEASTAKLESICTKLALRPGDRVVEIGGGWGGFAIHAARHHGVHVTTTTISAAQYRHMRQRVHAAGLDSRITVLRSDYRDLTGSYDALVSIEMIEALHWRDYSRYFAACSRLLKPDGLMALQAIVIGERSFERAKHTEDFLKRFIFPGSHIPSVGAIVDTASRAGDLRVIALEDIGRHYAETLARWRASFDAARDQHLHMGLDQRFLRLWRFYLAYCEAGFLERHVSDVQVVLAKPTWRPCLETRAR